MARLRQLRIVPYGRGTGCNMLFKVSILFLLGMVVIAMIGKLLFPGAIGRAVRKRIGPASSCGRCGRYVIGSNGCDCGKKG